MPVTSQQARRQPVDGIGEITVQHEDDPASRELACRCAQEWVDRLAAQNRPRALLQAWRLLVACLAADGRVDEAKSTLATIAAQCAQLGMVLYLIDGGRLVIAISAQLQTDKQAERWRSEWPDVPADFLDIVINTEVVQRI